ncbi:MAG: PilT/PilU family type 4a pilus ATPase [Deltaproteobacteria bacterium]|nr:PilT/PilU family type 4a pilus ATPase [Deltaproteobacteria bacterium]
MPALDHLFDRMLKAGASDLHLSVGLPPMLRAKGDLVPIEGEPTLGVASLESLLYEIVTEPQLRQFLTTHDLDFAYAYEDKARFRANYLGKTTGPGAVFRTIPTKILSAKDLGLSEAIVKLAERPSGLVLVTGPTGSGKSTTLAAMISHLNHSRPLHILTVEDPVEFVHQPAMSQITHREVGQDTPSFGDAIRSAIRENADVILVGELRGPETMRLALQSASFGILVFATVHTNSAAATIDRFVNAFPASEQPGIRGMLAESLAGIVAQQLLKKADGSGRIAVHEILVANSGIASAIREAKTSMLTNLLQSGGSEGMQTMDAALQRLMQQGKIKPTDALDKAIDKESFAKLPEVKAVLERAAG